MLVGSPASASEDDLGVVVPVTAGDRVPFDGMLYPVENAIRVSQKAEQCEYLLERNEAHCQRRLAFEDKLCSQVVDLHSDAALERERAMQSSLPTWAIVGIAYAAGALTIVVGAWTMGQVAQ